MAKHVEDLEHDKNHKPGCVNKHQGGFVKSDTCSYRSNGYSYLSSSHKDIYEIDFKGSPVDAARLPYIYLELKLGHSKKNDDNYDYANNPLVTKDAWWFKDSNFKVGYLPYNHNYHHILPFSALKACGYQVNKTLQAAQYNLNGEENMIILPCLAEYGVAMKLPNHPTDHPDYTSAVAEKVNSMKADVERNAVNHKITSKNVGDFKSKLISWEKRQFKKIVEYGEDVIAKMDPENVMDRNQIENCPMAPKTRA